MGQLEGETSDKACSREKCLVTTVISKSKDLLWGTLIGMRPTKDFSVGQGFLGLHTLTLPNSHKPLHLPSSPLKPRSWVHIHKSLMSQTLSWTSGAQRCPQLSFLPRDRAKWNLVLSWELPVSLTHGLRSQFLQLWRTDAQGRDWPLSTTESSKE